MIPPGEDNYMLLVRLDHRVLLFSAGALSMLAVAVLASLLPAMRSARVDPSIALREE